MTASLSSELKTFVKVSVSRFPLAPCDPACIISVLILHPTEMVHELRGENVVIIQVKEPFLHLVAPQLLRG